MNVIHSSALIFVVAAVTLLLRSLPFLVFRGGRKTPDVILYLSRVLPSAIMGMLIVYCLRKVTLLSGNHGLPELLACACVVALHLWKRNTLLSIASGTVIYMLLVQVVFV